MNALLRERFDATIKARTVADLHLAVSEIEQLMSALNRFIAREEERTRVSDVTQYTYSPAAMAARERVLKLNQSLSEFTAKLEIAVRDRDRAVAAVAALEATEKLFRRNR
jgi:uncharacterized protein YoxC